MSARTANSPSSFRLPSLSYIDAKWEEPNLRAPAATPPAIRRTGPAAWLSRQIAHFFAWRGNRQAAAELAAMSHRELRDIGLNRSDLARVFDASSNQDLRARGRYR